MEESVQKQLNYYDPTNDKVVAVALGKSANVTNFDQKANKTTSNGYSPATYFTNSNEFINYEKLSNITSTKEQMQYQSLNWFLLQLILWMMKLSKIFKVD
nr:hypothetical protein [Mycoplasmopsis bovis]